MKHQLSVLYLLMLIYFIFLSHVTAVSTTFTGAFNTNSPTSSQSYPYTSGSNYVYLTFTTTNVMGIPQFLMAAYTTNFTPNTTLSYYQHASLFNQNYDFQNANTGQTQKVQIQTSNPNNNVYIYVINLNTTSNNCSYTITVLQSNSLTNDCNQPSQQATGSLYCTTCLNQYAGSFCDIKTQNLSTTATSGALIGANTYVLFIIPGTTNQITLTFSFSNINNMYNMIQTRNSDTQISGLINYSPYGTGGFQYLNQPSTQYNTIINSGGSDIAVSFLNMNNSTGILTVGYTIQYSTNVLLIVLAVLGGILFIALLIVAIYIIKRIRNSDNIIYPSTHSLLAGSLIRPGQNVLTSQQIQMYFPSIPCRLIFPQQQFSTQNLMTKNNPNSNPIDRDCVICICPVINTDMMKVTYCNHIFHAHCLSEWFKKNRNCPYCREDYNRKATIDHYNAVLTNAHKNMLTGAELAYQIVNAKQAKCNLEVEEVKD